MAMDTVLANGNEAVVAFLDAAGAFDATSHKWIDVALKRAFGDDLSDCAGSDQDEDDQDQTQLKPGPWRIKTVLSMRSGSCSFESRSR